MSPTRPLRPCCQPGCPELVTRGYCSEHESQRERRTPRRKDPAQARFYGSARWKKIRAMVRREEPVCRICGERKTTNVDHIDGDWQNNHRENLRGLCTPCEKRRTGRQHRRKQDDGETQQPERRRQRWVMA